ncbi:unnamed protein product [Cylicocyclus nassatus]|uniref:Uncharacterized protein n=1 Tax=Cylicocyclus nassatus TaxID=53992 RepID=A0AA36MHG0_CYLNA|nr:unnamed protein product [Cylicocyclus nassatus]
MLSSHSSKSARRSENIVRAKMAPCPMLTELHKQQRLAFAEEKLMHPLDWSRIVWSNEKKFNLDGLDGFLLLA